jgi:hypothetical protein
MGKWFYNPIDANLEWIIRSELTQWKSCVILDNEGHSQNCEWPSLARITQPFYSVNSLLISHSSKSVKNVHIFVLSFVINLRIKLNSQIFGNIFIIRESVAQIEFPNTKFVYLKKWLTPNLDLHLYYLLLLRTTISYLSKIALILSLT